MSTVKGQYLLDILSEINEPVRLEDIVDIIMPRLKFTKSLLFREIKESLEAGVHYGYVQKCNQHYYSINHTLNALGEKIDYTYTINPREEIRESSDEEGVVVTPSGEVVHRTSHTSDTSNESLVNKKSKIQQIWDDECQRPSKLRKTNQEQPSASKSKESTKAPPAKTSSGSSDCEGEEVTDCAQCRRAMRRRSIKRRRSRRRRC